METTTPQAPEVNEKFQPPSQVNSPNKIELELPEGSKVTKEIVSNLDSFLRYIESPLKLQSILMKLMLVYGQQNGGIFGLKTEEIEDVGFLVKLLDDCQKK